jgi:hypothetical protein
MISKKFLPMAIFVFGIFTAHASERSEWHKVFPENRVFVGVIISGSDAGSIEVIKDKDRFLIPLEEFIRFSGCSIQKDTAIKIITPIGIVGLSTEDIIDIEGINYLSSSVITEKLKTVVKFDEKEFALFFDLPWRKSDGKKSDYAKEAVVPQAFPPKASVSVLRTEAEYVHDRTSDTVQSTTLVGGRLAGGRWRMQVDDDFAGNHDPKEYAWLYSKEKNLYLLGHQQVGLHPLINPIEFTGFQYAWTNQPADMFAASSDPHELLPRRLQPISSFKGPGPPGGIAELRIDGRIIARQTINLEGSYDFADIPLQSRQLNNIEVFVYERQNPATPIAIHSQTQSASDFMLPKGAVLHLGGVGRDGNLAKNLIDGESGEDNSRASGFYQWRYGISENHTLEAAAMQSAGNHQGMIGMISKLSPTLLTSIGLAASETGAAYDFTFESLKKPWRILGRSQWLGTGFQSENAQDSFDHLVEAGYSETGRFDISVIGRSRRQDGKSNDYILPALSWQPTSRSSLRIRPDSEGDYRADFAYWFNSSARFALSIQDRSYADFSFMPKDNLQIFLDSEFGNSQPELYSVGVSLSSTGKRHSMLYGSLSYADGQIGYKIAGIYGFFPGLMARVEFDSDSIITATQGIRDYRITFGITMDLAFSGGSILPAKTYSVREDRGAIAGKITLNSPEHLSSYTLENIGILLDGRLASKTVSGGSFFIGDLKPGIYRVEVDTEKLPIELTPEKTSVLAQVAEFGVTRADFSLRPEFGIAGRITDSKGNALAGIRVEIADQKGNKIAIAKSDNWGLYRTDGIPVGIYTLKIAPNQFDDPASELPSRVLEIRDDFLFEQNLRIPITR